MDGYQDVAAASAAVARLEAINANLKRVMNDQDAAAMIAVLSAKVAHQQEQLRQLNAALARKSWALKQQRRVLDQLFVADDSFRKAFLGVLRSVGGSRKRA